jgi:cephalosporin-C deacetylase-like acetyl esterase
MGQNNNIEHPKVSVERGDGIYNVDEEVRFLLNPMEGDPHLGSLVYRMSWDGEASIEEGEIDRLPFEISYSPQEPGFLRLSIHDSKKPGELVSQAAAAVSPLKIPPSLPVPEDFNEFWQDQVSKYLPERFRTETKKHSNTDRGKIFDTKIIVPGAGDIYGWLLTPPGEGPFPCVVRYHGAGVYPIPPENGLDLTSRGFMVLSINSHSIPNDRPLSYYEELQRGALSDYRTRGREDREKIYFRKMFLRAAGAVIYARERPECDADRLFIEGHSQGGGQALAAAALGGDISGLVVSCSTHCDHTGPVIGRVAGWPKIVEIRNGVPDSRQVKAARYIDGVNFASKIKCPTLFSACFLDDACPPTGIYAAYNSLAGPKEINNEVTTGHIHTENFKDMSYRWLSNRIR